MEGKHDQEMADGPEAISEAIKRSPWYQERLAEIEKWDREGESVLAALQEIAYGRTGLEVMIGQRET